jgi:two-component system, OmpR family, sensor histidine kinase KdpD
LREIALRLVASHTDDRLLAYMEARGITSPWESMVRVMAAVAPQPGLEPLIERAAAGARRAEGKLVVVSVDSGGEKDPRAAKALAAYQDLTLKLGGQFVTLKSNKPGQALLEYAKKTHVTEVVLARGDHKQKSGPLSSSIKREIIRGASQIDVHVLRAFDTQGEAGTAPEGHTAHLARLASEASEKSNADAQARQLEAEIEQAES